MVVDIEETPQSGCSAGLKIGEYVSELAPWCGKNGGRLGTYIHNRVRNPKIGQSYPTVITRARVIIEQTSKTDEFLLDDGFADIKNVASVKRTIPKEFMCKGLNIFVKEKEFGDTPVRDFKEDCEDCPYQII